ncbi:MAG: heme-dependent peroxidase [Candidatus Carbobacillus sp.]|nr:heme-dependent peroxidase [Candidatus Carbobacillus sp.]
MSEQEKTMQETEARHTAKAAHTVEGWHVLHDFYTIDWPAWKETEKKVRRHALEELSETYATWENIESEEGGSFGVFQIIGQKADLLFMHLRPSMDELLKEEVAFRKLMIADFLLPAHSYYSIVELGGYTGDPEQDPWAKGRLYPKLKRDEHVCFYPMNKKRLGTDNWYMLPIEDRASMMRSHGEIGKAYRGKVLQIISGSQGLDDWEWGVTLFSKDPLQFKKIIYEMRFDEVSARFGEFGAFFVGKGLDMDDLKEMLDV